MLRNSKLDIFENFIVDRSLPKYSESEKVSVTNSLGFGSSSGSFSLDGLSVPMAGSNSWGFNSGEKEETIGFWKKIFTKISEKRKSKKKTISILQFFSLLAQSLNDLKTLQDIAIHYETAITNAAKGGQTALVEQLKLRLASAKSEVQLLTMNLTKYLTEDQVINFYVKIEKDKNLKLTWIKNFIKPIPSKILDIKSKLDEQFIFDNYVILHYDPNNDATDLTEFEKIQEKKRKEDPILFGLIKDSRRLYYIGDWVDTYCDLTLDTVIETLGEKVNEMNNDTVKTYIDRGVREVSSRKTV